MRRRDRTRVVIAGGGIAGLEALMALHTLTGDRVQLTVLAPESEFLYRPVTVAEAFAKGEARSYNLGEIVTRDCGAKLIQDSLDEVEVDAQTIITRSGESVPYDILVVATGAIPTNPLPGALAFAGRVDVPALRGLLRELVDGAARSVAIAVPSAGMWPMPAYELALMTAAYVRASDEDGPTVYLVTPEDEPLELFGPEATAAITPLLKARGVTLRTISKPVIVRDRELGLAGGLTIFTDRVVTLPLLTGPRIPGLPHDRDGFIPVDRVGRVQGACGVYAAGDITSFPLKQGGLAAQQADAVAESIAADLGCLVESKPFSPVLRGLLMTGGVPLYLRCEPQQLPRSTSVAIDARRAGPRARSSSAASGQALWWPPAKVAGRYLSPYLASARPMALRTGQLVDRVAVPGPQVDDGEFQDALELALLLADCDARWGDYRSALSALDAAEALAGALPPEYAAKRREWLAAR
ncbi:MAG: NAD(P)/FAD-dependent oxidoreductase [Solirubrobacteraceae bacterium]